MNSRTFVSRCCAVVCAFTSSVSLLSAAPIIWQSPTVISSPQDISNPVGSTVLIAADFNTAVGTAVGDDNMVNGIMFTEVAPSGGGSLVTGMVNGASYNATFFTGSTGDGDLDAMLDSHSWFGGNPGTTSFTINDLVPGTMYQVQLIGVADARSCCGARTYEPDDGVGNFNTGVSVARGMFQTVIGEFTADSVSQVIGWRSLNAATGNNDPGLSGMVVLSLPSADDTDGDGLTDAWEGLYGLDPELADTDGDLIPDDEEDEDMDGLDNGQEQSAGTNPNVGDTDMDGYLDGVEMGGGVWVSAMNTGTSPLNPDSDGDTLLDGVENPDLPYEGAMQTGSDPNLMDTDMDTLPDNVEVSINLNPNDTDTDDDLTLDADEDADADFALNGEELANGTGISDPDSDDDQLLDGYETNTGEWASATDTGTNPLDADTDNDQLLDGVENPDLPYDSANPATQPGSNPHVWDTDGDLAYDGLEIDGGTDPTSASSTVVLPVFSFRPFLVGGDLTDPEDDGVDVEGTAGLNFDWMSITASSEAYFSDATLEGVSEGAFDVFDNKVGGGEAKWCCDAPPQDVTVEFVEPVSITHFTMTSSNDTPARDPLTWEIQGSEDGVNFTTIYARADAATPWTARNQTALFVLPTTSDAYKFIRYAVSVTGGVNHALNEIEYFGIIGGAPIQITNIGYDEDTEMISLTWTSKPGRTYGIYYDQDLNGFVNDVDDSVPSHPSDGTTTLTFGNPEPGVPRLFFRVVENASGA